MSILQLFLAPSYKTLSALSGITLDSSEVLAQLAGACNDDLIEIANAKNERLYVQSAIALSLTEAFILRDFAKASHVILKYQDFFHMLQDQQHMKINNFEGELIVERTHGAALVHLDTFSDSYVEYDVGIVQRTISF